MRTVDQMRKYLKGLYLFTENNLVNKRMDCVKYYTRKKAEALHQEINDVTKWIDANNTHYHDEAGIAAHV